MDCPPGYFCTEPLNATICPAGSFCPNRSIVSTKCPTFSTSLIGAKIVTECFCETGYEGEISSIASACTSIGNQIGTTTVLLLAAGVVGFVALVAYSSQTERGKAFKKWITEERVLLGIGLVVQILDWIIFLCFFCVVVLPSPTLSTEDLLIAFSVTLAISFLACCYSVYEKGFIFLQEMKLYQEAQANQGVLDAKREKSYTHDIAKGGRKKGSILATGNKEEVFRLLSEFGVNNHPQLVEEQPGFHRDPHSKKFQVFWALFSNESWKASFKLGRRDQISKTMQKVYKSILKVERDARQLRPDFATLMFSNIPILSMVLVSMTYATYSELTSPLLRISLTVSAVGLGAKLLKLSTWFFDYSERLFTYQQQLYHLAMDILKDDTYWFENAERQRGHHRRHKTGSRVKSGEIILPNHQRSQKHRHYKGSRGSDEFRRYLHSDTKDAASTTVNPTAVVAAGTILSPTGGDVTPTAKIVPIGKIGRTRARATVNTSPVPRVLERKPTKRTFEKRRSSVHIAAANATRKLGSQSALGKPGIKTATIIQELSSSSEEESEQEKNEDEKKSVLADSSEDDDSSPVGTIILENSQVENRFDAMDEKRSNTTDENEDDDSSIVGSIVVEKSQGDKQPNETGNKDGETKPAAVISKPPSNTSSRSSRRASLRNGFPNSAQMPSSRPGVLVIPEDLKETLPTHDRGNQQDGNAAASHSGEPLPRGRTRTPSSITPLKSIIEDLGQNPVNNVDGPRPHRRTRTPSSITPLGSIREKPGQNPPPKRPHIRTRTPSSMTPLGSVIDGGISAPKRPHVRTRTPSSITPLASVIEPGVSRAPGIIHEQPFRNPEQKQSQTGNQYGSNAQTSGQALKFSFVETDSNRVSDDGEHASSIGEVAANPLNFAVVPASPAAASGFDNPQSKLAAASPPRDDKVEEQLDQKNEGHLAARNAGLLKPHTVPSVSPSSVATIDEKQLSRETPAVSVSEHVDGRNHQETTNDRFIEEDSTSDEGDDLDEI